MTSVVITPANDLLDSMKARAHVPKMPQAATQPARVNKQPVQHMSAFAMTVTPEQAALWLKHNNYGNRKLRPRRIKFYADQIRRGEWKVSSQGLSFAVSGRLLNGQHRLWAIIRTGIAVEMWVTVNEPDQNFDVIDTGMNRPAEAALGMTPSEVAVARMILNAWQKAPYFSNAQVAAIATVTNPVLRTYMTGGASGRQWASAPVKTGAVLRILEGRDIEYVVKTYKALTLSIFPDMSPLVQSFYKQYNNNPGRKTSGQAMEFLVRAFKAYDERSKHFEKMTIKDTEPTLVLIRNIIATKFPAQVLATPDEDEDD